MSKTLMLLLLIPLLAVACLTQNKSFAGCLDQTGCSCLICPSCNHECKFEAKNVKETKKGFDVEQKVICIPRVVFPWQRSKNSCGCSSKSKCDCTNNGARTRKINVLKTVKYECPKCQYKWSTKEKHNCKSSSRNNSCTSSCSGACASSIQKPQTNLGRAAVMKASPESEVTMPSQQSPAAIGPLADYYLPAKYKATQK